MKPPPGSRPKVAISTNSCPHLRAAELAEAIASCGGDAAELRVGRGHGWERDGAPAIVGGGVAVTTVASSRTFGAEAAPESGVDVVQAASVGAWVRCFLDAAYEDDAETASRAHAQVAPVQKALGDDGAVLIEAHPGYASLPAVAAFCAGTGAGAVIDTFALRRLGIEERRAFSTLGSQTRVLHVKGFERERERWRWRPLELEDLPGPAALTHAPALAAVVVETKARSPWRDLRLLRRWAEATNW